MNPAVLLVRLLSLLPRRAGGAAPAARPGRRSRRSARTAVIWAAAAFLALTAAASVAMNLVAPQIRDPEYGRRIVALKARMAENPGRPVAVVIGSSRSSMGVCPAAWEESRPNGARPDPLLFNLSLVGSGPVMELMTLRRMYADGVRPDAVVLEYWPPFLRQDGPYFEPDRIDVSRLRADDRELVRGYFPDPAATERRMLVNRLHPLYENRHRLMAQVEPRWLPWDRRLNVGWENLDRWGWLPGLDEHPPRPELRAGRLSHCRPIYHAQFYRYAVHPLADRAIREAVALARANGARVALAYLPESSEFRGWYPPEVERAAHEHLIGLCRELDLPLIDARPWMPDELLVDGFHLSRVGAAAFTRKFGPAAAKTFPDLGRR